MINIKNINKRKVVFIAMSGGVDSSVAALLLKKIGYKVIGVFMHCFSAEGGSASGGNLNGCAEHDAEDARQTAQKLEIPFYIWNFEKEYKRKVVKYMINGYKKGTTPNPDVMCNKEIKFGLFLKKVLAMGADYVATGHYIKIQKAKSKKQNNNSKFKIIYKLFQAKDKNKDQSYFLWTLTQKQLRHCLFPIGNYLKSEVRKIAKKADLPAAEKKDSQGICFLGKISLKNFLNQYLPQKQGDVLTVKGEKIGEHSGAHFYTIGQRHFNILNFQPSAAINKNRQPYYIVRKDVKKNILIVAEGDNHPCLYQREIKLKEINFINNEIKISHHKIPVLTRIRYRQPLASATLIINRQLSTLSYKLIFAKPQKFITPGQSAVFYSKQGELLGGGVII